MTNKKVYLCLIFFGLASILSYAQQDLSKQIPKKETFNPEEVVDSVMGIVMYERLNHRLVHDSIRHCKGYACQGIVKDYYDNGKLLHMGYYVDGQLASYTNYYPNGHTERVFRVVDDFKSEMILYYPTGKIKSKHWYNDFVPVKWEDYYPNGKLSYHMEHDKELDMHTVKRHYNEKGMLTSEIFLSNKKKMLFRQYEYYETGVPKVKGELTYDHDLVHHVKNGKWIYYRPNGSVEKKEVYEHDKLISPQPQDTTESSSN